MENIKVWEPASREECLQSTGRPPITTKWVDVGKGRGGEVHKRSRIVEGAFKVENESQGFDVCAATPPLDMKRLLLRTSRVQDFVGGDKKGGPVKLMFIDGRKAHLNGVVAKSEFEHIALLSEAGGGIGR